MITESGTDPKVAGLMYMTAFAPDKGESVASLIANLPPGAPVPPILPPQDGFLFLNRGKRRVVCSGREARSGRLHGRLPGSLGA